MTASHSISAKDSTLNSRIVTWTFVVLFVVIGILNMLLVHPAPGAFYLLVSVVHLPATNALFRKAFGFSIPLAAKAILGLVVLWATLAVTDLAQMAGF